MRRFRAPEARTVGDPPGVACPLLVPAGMARNADDLFQELLKKMADGAPEPHRHRKRRRLIDEEPEGLYPPPRRPGYSGSPSPFEDPLRHIKRPLLARNGPDRGGAHVEFSQVHIVEIRYKFHAPSASSPACSGSVCRR